jgi:hypothetical protein
VTIDAYAIDAISKLIKLPVRTAGENPDYTDAFATLTEKRRIAEDAMKLLGTAIDDFGGAVPSVVRVFLTQYAQRTAVGAYYDMLAEQAGLQTPEGMKFSILAAKHGQASQLAYREARKAFETHTAQTKTSGLERLRAKIG